jgi:hypothetical protein
MPRIKINTHEVRTKDITIDLPRHFEVLSLEERNWIAGIMRALCDVPAERRTDMAAWALSAMIQARLFERNIIDALVNGVT